MTVELKERKGTGGVSLTFSFLGRYSVSHLIAFGGN